MSGITEVLTGSRGSAQQAAPPVEDELQQNQLEDPLVAPAAPAVAAPEGPQAWSDHTCMIKLQVAYGASWTTMHAELGDSPEGKAARARFVAFRKSYVDGLIDQLRQKYPGLLAKSVGSKDLTSDYDLTVSTPGSSGDVEAMREFNKVVERDFGAQPGTVFDTNLYAKDYLGVEENINATVKQKVTSGELAQDTPLEQPEAFEDSGRVDQDVAALVKVRRYMLQTDYDAYVEKVVGGIQDSAERAAVRKQYEEADAIFQLGAKSLLDRLGNVEVPDDALSLTKEETAAVGQFSGEARAIYKAQLEQQKKLAHVTHHEGDDVLAASNELYYERMKELRKVQAAAAVAERASGDQSLEELKAGYKADALRAQAKKLLGDAIFFAAEAYHSEGAVKHVVAGLQGENAAAALEALKPEDLLQSFNEQFGDFMKDVGHYADAHEGKLYYRTSKYVFRLFDAVKLLESKAGVAEVVKAFSKEFGWAPAAMAATIGGGLLPIRKGDRSFEPAPPKTAEDVKNESAVALGRAAYGVTGRDEFVAKVMDYSARLNGAVRSVVSSQVSAQETRGWFKNREG